MSLPDLFAASLKLRAGEPGLEFGGAALAFGEIAAASNRLANFLLTEGLEPGDRLAVYLGNSAAFVEIYTAAVKAGLIFTPINILYREREVEHILADAEAGAIVTDRAAAAGFIGALAARLGVRLIEIEGLAGHVAGQPARAPAVRTSEDSIAALVYTSGTTGKPKGAMLTHGNFAANARSLIEAWRMSADDRLLLTLPLFHVHGLGNGLHTWLALGYRMRLLERFRKETIAAEFLDFRPTVFFGVPTMYERLLETPPETAREIGGFVRLFVSGSAPLSAATLQRFQDLFGQVILERYGMSETLMNTSNPYDGERRAGSVGVPLPGVSIRIDGSGSSGGEAGELLIKGPNVFAGYWGQPQATREAFTEDGYFRSGDLGVRSDDGYYTLQGRAKELIISGGFNIYPREVEEFLTSQPGVREAAVMGIPDRVKGEAPAAFLVLEDGCRLDIAALEAACREGLASFKIPKRFVEVGELPRNALGKVQKHLLAG